MSLRAMRLDSRMFSSQVARRAFMTFIACALVPVCALAILAFQQVTSHLRQQAERRLHQSSKQAGIALLNRLLAAEEALGQVVEASGARARLPRALAAARWTGPGGPGRALFGEMPEPTLAAAQAASLATGKTVLSTDRDGSGRVRVVVSRPVDPLRAHDGVVHGVVDPAFLWALDGDVALAADAKLVVLDDAGRVLFSSFGSDQVLPEGLTRQAAQRAAGHFEWRARDGDYLATHRALFLQASMAVPRWTIVLSQPKADVFAPIATFKRIFALVIVLTLLTIVLLSGRQIRRSLTPLAELKEGARRLAMGDLGTRVEVASRDEFAEVATAFNNMAAQLGRQFHTLALRREITAALDPAEPLEPFLQVCADAVTRHLGLPLVGVWLTGDDPAVFQLSAHARAAGTAGEPPPRVPMTEDELARLRADRQPFVTHSLREDPRRGDLTWETGQGFVAFLAHPLVTDGRVVGIAGAFATRAFEATELSAFGLAAGDIAAGIDRKRIEAALRDSETQTRQLQKMEAVGQLAGGIAHDFNNLLTVITGRTYLLLAGLPADHPHRKGIQTIDATAQRAALLTRQLLAFSRKQVLAPTVLDLNEVVEGLEDILHRLIGESIDLGFTLAPALGKAKLDRGQIEQVLVNLVVNARDAMPEGGRIVVETTNVDLDEAFLRQDGDHAPGPHVMVAVTDTGTGMDEKTRARIFEPFFTTKAVGKGTGLGLATVLGIVQQSGGCIRVESQVGVGTTFRIYFSQVDEAATPEAGALAPPRGGSETVLVVDDEVEVQALLQTALTSWGYTVLGVTSPSDAIRLAEHHPAPIDLLVTDMVMPEMSGAALSERLLAMHPEMALLFMSGYADYSAESIPHGRARTGFLQKPFAPDAVARKVRHLLDAADPRPAGPVVSDAPLWGSTYGQSPSPTPG
jgi:signal transduction histidine kinase/ActR/RegA family two-component response regulator/HAMP domain-containing protein